jgi:hypothetical protein
LNDKIYLVWWGLHWEPDVDSVHISRESAELRGEQLQEGAVWKKYYGLHIEERVVENLIKELD